MLNDKRFIKFKSEKQTDSIKFKDNEIHVLFYSENNFLLSEKAIEKLKYYSWPGNIRELQNTLQQGLIRAKMDGVTQIREDHLFSEAKNSVECIENSNDLSFSNEKNKWEKQFISKQLDLHSWNITKTAASLKMSRSYLNKLVKDFQLKKP